MQPRTILHTRHAHGLTLSTLNRRRHTPGNPTLTRALVALVAVFFALVAAITTLNA